MASHPDSTNLWVDSPLNADEFVSQSIAVFDKRDLDGGFRRVDVAAISKVGEGPKRVLQPTYDPTGREVWVVVWNCSTTTRKRLIDAVKWLRFR